MQGGFALDEHPPADRLSHHIQDREGNVGKRFIVHARGNARLQQRDKELMVAVLLIHQRYRFGKVHQTIADGGSSGAAVQSRGIAD